MNSSAPLKEEIDDLSIPVLGEAEVLSPLNLKEEFYIEPFNKIMLYVKSKDVNSYLKSGKTPPMFENSGPMKHIYFNPCELTCGIVTCGGLCPGLNDVIRTITLTLCLQYGVPNVLGFRYGYQGMKLDAEYGPVELTPELVDGIHHRGGTILGSSRGTPSSREHVDTLLKYKINLLFVVGGDGTFRGAHALVEEIEKRNLDIAVVGIPKTIDNDIYCSETTFGFETAVEEARKSIACAHEEAKAAYNGISLVKLMGRDSGFIAANAALANSDVNFCLIPENPVDLYGEKGFLSQLEERLQRKHHVVIVVAEGAGQGLLQDTDHFGKDASGNARYQDVGIFLKQVIQNYFKKKNMAISFKYIDPSYTIRSCPANAKDSIFCLLLGQMAVHAGMAGKTDMFIGYWNRHFVNIPFSLAINKRKKVDPDGVLWQTLMAITEQEL